MPSLPVLPAGEVEEDGLEARRQARRVAHGQAEPGGLLHELGEHAFGTRGAGSPSTVTVISVSAPCLCFSSAGVSTASALPWSMIATRSQRTSASSM